MNAIIDVNVKEQNTHSVTHDDTQVPVAGPAESADIG